MDINNYQYLPQLRIWFPEEVIDFKEGRELIAVMIIYPLTHSLPLRIYFRDRLIKVWKDINVHSTIPKSKD